MLPQINAPEDQAGRLMAQEMGRAFFGRSIIIPGSEPLLRSHINCVLNAYRERAALYRSRLTGDLLDEVRLTPQQRGALQQALTDKGFLPVDRLGPGLHDGEFGPITRNAIRTYQQSIEPMFRRPYSR